MLYPRHPKPVVDPRPVATHSIRQEAQALPSLGATAEFEPKLAAPVQDVPIRFTVRYRFGEYLALVRDQTAIVLKERGRKPQGRLGDLLMPAVIGPIFLFKKWRVGDCRFELDADGLTRTSRAGSLRLAWRDTTAIHRRNNAYLVAVKRGAMPLPYRCFSAAERERFDRWTAACA